MGRLPSGKKTVRSTPSNGIREVCSRFRSTLDYQHFNGQGHAPARYFAVTNAPFMMNLFHKPGFHLWRWFHLRRPFSARRKEYFSGKRKTLGPQAGSQLRAQRARYSIVRVERARRRRQNLTSNWPQRHGLAYLGFPVGRYKKAHRHGPGAHVIILGGQGYPCFGPPMTAKWFVSSTGNREALWCRRTNGFTNI